MGYDLQKTPGGNAWLGGQGTFAQIVEGLRAIALNRDIQDTEIGQTAKSYTDEMFGKTVKLEPVKLGANRNISDLLTPGDYIPAGSSSVTTALDYPRGLGSVRIAVRNWGTAAEHVMQIITPLGNHPEYRRWYNGTKWSSWYSPDQPMPLPTGGAAHLDELLVPGEYIQASASNVTPELGWPGAYGNGRVRVVNWGSGDTQVQQVVEPLGNYPQFKRFYNGTKWSSWWASAVTLVRSDRTKVLTVGDSRTQMGAGWTEAEKWPTILGNILATATTFNAGISGATCDEIMLGIGAYEMWFTVDGGQIPATGNASLTTGQRPGVMPNKLFRWAGTLAGRHGQLVKGSTGDWAFVGDTQSSPTPASGSHRFIPDWSGHEADVSIVWMGRNNITAQVKGTDATVVDHVVAAHQRLYEWLSPRMKSVMILGTDPRISEETGSLAHTQVQEINARLKALYPGNYAPVVDWIRTRAMAEVGISPTATDTQKLNAGTVPPSLYDDDVHINRATANALARTFIKPWLVTHGHVDA